MGQVDVLSFQLPTMGQRIADFADELFAVDSYGACPNFEGRAKMMERLEPGRIGVDLSEE